MSPDKYLIILYNRTRLGPFRVYLLSVTCQLIKTGFHVFLFFFPPSLSNLVIKSVTPYRIDLSVV